MPANDAISPDSTYSSNLIRLTRIPENCAVSDCSPMAKIERPTGVAWSTTPNTIAKTRKKPTDQGTWVCGIGCTPILVSHSE